MKGKTLKASINKSINNILAGALVFGGAYLIPAKAQAAGRLEVDNLATFDVGANYVTFWENQPNGAYLPYPFPPSTEIYYEDSNSNKHSAARVNLSSNKFYNCPLAGQGPIPDGASNSIAFKIVSSFPSNTLCTASITTENGFSNFVNDVLAYTAANSNSQGYAFVTLPVLTNASDRVYGKVVMRFAPLEQIVSSAGSNGTIIPAGSLYVPWGEGTNFQINANNGYRVSSILTNGIVAFTNLATSGLSSTNFNWNNIISNGTIYAGFDINKYKIESLPVTNGNGTINPTGTNLVTHGGNLEFILLGNQGYELDNVRTNNVLVPGLTGGNSNNFNWANIVQDGTIEAGFKKILYPVMITSAGNGINNPSGMIYVPYGDSTNILMTASPYYQIANVKTNNVSLPWVYGMSSTNLLLNVTGTNDVHTVYSPNLTPNGIPHYWLAGYGLGTNDSVETQDYDSDGFDNFNEYIADTDPTNRNSYLPKLRIAKQGNDVYLEQNPTSVNRVNTIYSRTNLADGAWQAETNSIGNGTNVVFHLNTDSGRMFYKSKVSLP